MESLDLRPRLLRSSSARVVHGSHIVTFQPAETPNEDRFFAENWSLPNGRWKMLAIFDGHGAGTEAVDFVLDTLPGEIKSALNLILNTLNEATSLSNELVEVALTKCMCDLDLRIQSDFTALFPDEIERLSKEEISQAMRDPESSEGHSRVEVLRARTGTTAIVALIDPKDVIHVASLGDCDAVLATMQDTVWEAQTLSARHNCANESEVARIRAEHPDEPYCVNTDTLRTLGLIAVTRALGDTLFKLPAVYTERVAPLSLPPIHSNYDLEALAARNITPPYLSNAAEVTHVAVPQLAFDAEAPQRLLILASDGLVNILSRSKNVRELPEAAGLWSAAAVSGGSKNMAVNVLWDTLLCEDGSSLYAGMVQKQHGQRVDDITIIVCPL
ncbi:phosphatase 2C-like domain-containing protein [Mycena alexandri]|uniref:Phosphatase 2C-like domain-containing protein n=1 Tax=Mycena alexandri TaxID=1745969 RepID=A0AAD6SN53_9AGAR|nr:phosphatase 2C-like domain-containing protein [Mycena alexandri]